MDKTQVLSNIEVRNAILEGVNIMADAVKSTLGPKGKNVGTTKSAKGEVFERKILHDGVSVARSIDLMDEKINFSAQIIKEASQKQVDQVGDGTTVVMILAQAIINECMQLVASGINPMSLRKGLESASEELIRELETMATPVKDKKELEFVATISAQDAELGRLITEAFTKVGVDGVVTAEESKSPDTMLEIQEGMQLDKGYMSEWFRTSQDREEAVLENAYFLITDKPITSLVEFTKFFEEFTKLSKNLVIISPDISGEAFPLFVQNKVQGKLLTICIQAPSFGEDQKNILQDIAVLTDGKFISQEAGYQFQDLTVDDLGFAESITSTKNDTIIVGGRGSKKTVQTRIASIKNAMENIDSGDKSEFDRERMKARLGKLTNGVAIIRVGGQTEIEMKERRERVLDSIGATRAAMEKGIVAGGETVYLHIRKLLQVSNRENRKDYDRNSLQPSTDFILYKALYEPFKTLITNADLSEIDMALALNGKGKNFGVDVNDGQVKDMLKAGIVDPVLVSINAIKNAVSVSVQLITTGTIILPDIKEK